MPVVKYRAYHPNLVPRRTKLEVPGWAGQPEPRADGSTEHPWHCIPFSEYARAGVELPYPGPTAIYVRTENGSATFTAPDATGDETEIEGFRTFGAPYYTFQLALDLKPEDGAAIKIETHPRFYADTTGTVPIAVPAIIRAWWPMVYFVVFKVPAPGETHIFRPGEPFLLVTLVDADEKLELAVMPENEAAEREMQSRRIYASRSTLSADSQWTSSTNTVFDGTYRKLFGAAKSSKDG